jgi:hypothetical protein
MRNRKRNREPIEGVDNKAKAKVKIKVKVKRRSLLVQEGVAVPSKDIAEGIL